MHRHIRECDRPVPQRKRRHPGPRRPTHPTGASAPPRPPPSPRVPPRARRGGPDRSWSLARRSVSSGLARVPVGSERATPTRTVPTSTPSTRPARRAGAGGRGGIFRCGGQPPLRSISVVSCETGGKPWLRSISVVGWYTGVRAGGRARPRRRNGRQLAPPSADRAGVLGARVSRESGHAAHLQWRPRPPARRPATPRGCPRGPFRRPGRRRPCRRRGRRPGRRPPGARRWPTARARAPPR